MPYRLPGTISTIEKLNRRQLVAGAWITVLLLLALPALGQVQLMSEKYAGSPEGDAIGGCFRGAAPGGTSNPYRTGRPISDDGRYVVFQSIMDGLDPLDNNGLMDVFRRDLQTGVTELVSTNFAGDASGNGVSGDFDTSFCQNAMISADGRYVAFHSFASDLVATDSNDDSDVFRRDMQSESTELISINATGTDSSDRTSQHPVMSPDGRFIAFESDGKNITSPPDTGTSVDVFVRDMDSGTTQLASEALDGAHGDRSSVEAAISDDWRYVAFRSTASDLHALDTDTNLDIFQRDLVNNTTALVSIDTLTTGSADDNLSRQVSMSGDGRYVVFKSRATNLVAADTNSKDDVFAWDRDAAIGSQIKLVSANKAGTDSGSNSSSQPVISRDGSRISFRSSANDLDARDVDGTFDVYARDTSDLVAAIPTYYLVSATPGDLSAAGSSQSPAISVNGRYVVFRSTANDIAALDNAGEDVFLRDLQAATTTLASPNSDSSASGNDSSENPAISGDGNTVAFSSEATDLVANDINARDDVFAFKTNTVSLVSARDPDTPSKTGNEISWVESRGIVSNPRRRQISASGRYAVFVSEATNLDLQSNGNGHDNVYRRDLFLGTNKLVNIDENGLIPTSGSSNEPSISLDGNRVAFRSNSSLLSSDPTNTDIYVRDMTTGTIFHASANESGGSPNGSSTGGVISGDGKHVLFLSTTTNIHANDTDNGRDVYVRDLDAGTTDIASISFDGSSGGDNSSTGPGSISDDGRFVVFESRAHNLVDTVDLGITVNASTQVYMHDRQQGTTVLVSIRHDGTAFGDRGSDNPVISGNGQRIAYESDAFDLVDIGLPSDTATDIFVWEAGLNEMVSLDPAGTDNGTSASEFPSMSLDGRYIAFQSKSNNLSGATHANGSQRSVMVRDVVNDTTELVDFNFSNTASGDKHAQSAAISSNGRQVVFESISTDLVSNDFNTKSDFFLRDLDAKTTTLLSVSLSGTAAGNRKGPGATSDLANLPSISGDGKNAIFHSRSSDLVSGDYNDAYDAFAWARLDTLFRGGFEGEDE